MAAAATITIAGPGGLTADLTPTIAGTSVGLATGSTIAIFDNGSTSPAATTSVMADGTWSTDVLLTHGANSLVANATADDAVVAASNPFDLDVESVLSTPSNAAAPSASASVPEPAAPPSWHELHSLFTFGAAPGQVLITGFHLAGPGHDVVSLPPAFASVAQALHNLHDVGGDAVLSFGPRGTITFDGLTAAELRAHPHDFRLHA